MLYAECRILTNYMPTHDKIMCFYFLFTGIYHCYDGVVREDPRLDSNKSKKFWVMVKDSMKKLFGLDTYHKQLVEDAELAILAFQPEWQLKSMKSDGLNGEEMISQVKLIMEGLRRVYVQEIGLMYGSGFDPLFAGVSILKKK